MDLYNNEVMQQIGERLLERKETLAVAESVTSGAIQLGISTIKDASKFFHGGITAYNVAQKFHHLKVEPIHAIAVNCVSKQVAEQMALHVAGMFSGNWSVAITGYAVPAPESDNEVFAWYAISYNGKVLESGKINPDKDETLNLQFYFANEVCSRLKSAIENADQPKVPNHAFL